jgi:hypothetical protein
MLTIYKHRAVLVACGLLASTLSCRSMQREELRMRIEIDVYSGRPNPEFHLSEAQSKELARMLQGLPAANREAPESGLGYRGFVVSETGGSGLPSRLRVFDGLVINEDAQPAKAFVDSNGAEAWLKQQARQAGYGTLVN